MPRPDPPVHVAEVYVPVAEAPVIAMGARGVASHLEMLLPASITGVSPHVMVLVSEGLVPEHAPLPVRVTVAVKLPLVVVGVKVASAGLAFCVHVPRPAPPVHVAEE